MRALELKANWNPRSTKGPEVRRSRPARRRIGGLLLVAWLVAGCGNDGNAVEDGAAAAPAAAAPAASGAIGQIDAFIASQNIDKSNASWKTQLPKPPKAKFAADKSFYWLLKTNVGTMKLKLMPDVAPMHVSSTIYLTRLGFYDNVPFHRVITGFMAQGGDPLGRGTGGPGYKYAGEFDKKVKHDRKGLLSMANAGPGTDGSQFFITFVPTPHLDGRHTLFGEVVEGMGTLKELESRGSRSGKPTQPLSIEKAEIIVE